MPRLQESSISLTFSPQSGVNQFQNLSPLSEIDVAFRFRVTFLPRKRGLELKIMATRKIENSKQTNESDENGVTPNLLVGYVRRSNAG